MKYVLNIVFTILFIGLQSMSYAAVPITTPAMAPAPVSAGLKSCYANSGNNIFKTGFIECINNPEASKKVLENYGIDLKKPEESQNGLSLYRSDGDSIAFVANSVTHVIYSIIFNNVRYGVHGYNISIDDKKNDVEEKFKEIYKNTPDSFCINQNKSIGFSILCPLSGVDFKLNNKTNTVSSIRLIQSKRIEYVVEFSTQDYKKNESCDLNAQITYKNNNATKIISFKDEPRGVINNSDPKIRYRVSQNKVLWKKRMHVYTTPDNFKGLFELGGISFSCEKDREAESQLYSMSFPKKINESSFNNIEVRDTSIRLIKKVDY